MNAETRERPPPRGAAAVRCLSLEACIFSIFGFRARTMHASIHGGAAGGSAGAAPELVLLYYLNQGDTPWAWRM